MNSIYNEVLAAIHSVWHRRWLALAVAWGVCILGWLAVALIPNSYESRARIFVQLYDPLAEQIGIGVGDRRRDMERVRQTLTSAGNLEKVVRSTRIGEDVNSSRDMEIAVLRLGKDIKVQSQQDNLFEITATSRNGTYSEADNARLAQNIVQKMIDIFREENLAGSRGEMSETIEFMNRQLATREKELETAEQKRLAFEARHPELAQGGAGLVQRLEAGRSELRGIEADLAAAQSALAAINGQLAGTPPAMAGSGGPRAALQQAQSDLSAMRARGLTENHPDVIATSNQIAALKGPAQNDSGTGGMPNPAYSSLQAIKGERDANIRALESRRASLQSELAAMTARQIDNPEVAAEAQRIMRDYDVLKQQYDKLLADREALRLRGQVETERSAVKFQVVDPPTSPRTPAAPNRPLLLAAVLILGIGAGAGTAFAVAQLKNTFSTTAKLERVIGQPVLGAISYTLTEAGRELRRRRLRHFIAGSAALCGLFILLVVVELIQVGMVA